MANVYRPDFDADRCARLGEQAGARKLAASLHALEPGAASLEFAADDGAEELLVVLDGTPTLGDRDLTQGDVVSGLAGGTQPISNRSEAPARVLIVSTRKES